ncbi:hypothetical protein C8R47DRAFT_1063288 [Mycena vitilis]|nr:hypothetical protein C8R47DRAFT_1063288 [Mycena vitilis]
MHDIPVVAPISFNSSTGATSVTPAWRDSLWHCRHNFVRDELGKLAPNSGAYMNEGNVYESNHEVSYWGPNYPRLLEVKHKYLRPIWPSRSLEMWFGQSDVFGLCIRVRVRRSKVRKKNGPPSRVAVVELENIETVHAPKHIQAAGALCMDRVAVLWSVPTPHRPREVKGPMPSRLRALHRIRLLSNLNPLASAPRSTQHPIAKLNQPWFQPSEHRLQRLDPLVTSGRLANALRVVARYRGGFPEVSRRAWVAQLGILD